MIQPSVSGLAIRSCVMGIFAGNPGKTKQVLPAISEVHRVDCVLEAELAPEAATAMGGQLNPARFQVSDDGLEGQIGGGMLVMGVLVRFGPGMRTTRTAGLGASPERLVDDGLDGARAAAAFGAAAEAAIDLLGISGKVFCRLDRTADIMVAEDVARTDNHETGGPFGETEPIRYLRPRRDAKGKTVFSSDSKVIRHPHWNESKKAQEYSGINDVANPVSLDTPFIGHPLR